jgi:hypothetical protein
VAVNVISFPTVESVDELQIVFYAIGQDDVRREVKVMLLVETEKNFQYFSLSLPILFFLLSNSLHSLKDHFQDYQIDI